MTQFNFNRQPNRSMPGVNWKSHMTLWLRIKFRFWLDNFIINRLICHRSESSTQLPMVYIGIKSIETKLSPVLFLFRFQNTIIIWKYILKLFVQKVFIKVLLLIDWLIPKVKNKIRTSSTHTIRRKSTCDQNVKLFFFWLCDNINEDASSIEVIKKDESFFRDSMWNENIS